MFSEYMYYLLWLVAHTIIALITQTRDVYLLVYNIAQRAYVRCIRWYCNGQFNVFDDCVKLKKVPQHVTILLPMTGFNLSDLVNLVIWSMATSITYISFHDPSGLLHKREEDLIRKIQEQLVNGQKLIWHGATTSGTNGYTGPKIHGKVLSSGRSLLVDSCKHLATTTTADTPLQISMVDAHQKHSYEFPDPQLGIYFGKYCNMNGYPPWQIRLTEFINVERLDHITEYDFVHVLQRYNTCQQRVGK